MIRLIAIALLILAASPSPAATFSVVTAIYVGSSVKPTSEHRILFDQGLAYDLSITEDRFTTIYDSAQGQVILLDRESKVQTIIALDDLLKVTAEAKASVSDPGDRRRLGIDAKVTFDDGYKMKFAGTEYFTKTEKPADSGIARDYGRFADLALRMNLVRPVGMPPFARMTLNIHIASKGEIPTESTLTLKRGKIPSQYRSSNQVGELTESDRTSIKEIRAMMEIYRQVPLKDFPTS